MKTFYLCFLLLLLLFKPEVSTSIDFCPTCVNFVQNSFDELVNIIANIGVLASCTELCNYFGTDLEIAVCDALCSTVGLSAFVELIVSMESHPDPIYLCKELTACDSRNGSANILNFQMNPSSIKIGEITNATATLEVIKQTGTGEVCLYLQYPSDSKKESLNIFGLIFQYSCSLIEDLPVGNFPVVISVPTSQEKELKDPALWVQGMYTAILVACEGTCYSNYGGSFIYSIVETKFTVL